MLLFVLFFFGCSHVTRVSQNKAPAKVNPIKTNSHSTPEDTQAVASRELEEIFLKIEQKIEEEEKDKLVQKVQNKAEQLKILSQNQNQNQTLKIPDSEMPIEMNKQVKNWIHYFSVRDRERFRRFLERGKRHRDVVAATLSEHGLPPELYYLAMIESGYQSHAVSHASAVGVWQFISGTGTRYGLAINPYTDERRDPIRATDAAARYLRDLHNAFQCWYLAMASYNAGENRILSAILRGKTRNYWELSEKKMLPRETREYVPKFLAAVIIGRHPEKFGFMDLEKPEYPNVKAVEVPTRVMLRDIASLAKISLSELEMVNPHILRKMTPPSGSTYEIWVPENKETVVKNLFPRLAKMQQPLSRTNRVVAQQQGNFHRVKQGESLSKIASQYKLTVAYLRRINNLSGSTIYPGQNLRIRSNSYNNAQRSNNKTRQHQVRRGDSLSSISRRYNVKINALKKRNNLKRDSIYAGQRLIIPAH